MNAIQSIEVGGSGLYSSRQRTTNVFASIKPLRSRRFRPPTPRGIDRLPSSSLPALLATSFASAKRWV